MNLRKIDLEFLDWLGGEQGAFAIVFTKADKLGVNAAQRSNGRILQETIEDMGGVASGIRYFFRKKGRGVKKSWDTSTI